MKDPAGEFFCKIENKSEASPLYGHLELTYRCNIRCIHCYARGSEGNGRELSTAEWKRVIGVLRRSGCLSLTFTGGEPLIREDFWELYSFAKRKGFLVSILTNGILFEKSDLKFLKRLPPRVIEITLNGITERTYESITQVPGSFDRAMVAIKRIKESRLPLVLKANCLRQNKEELSRIKDFALRLLWRKPRKTYPFKYDPIIYPRLNGDLEPCRYRLEPEDIVKLWKEEPLVWEGIKRVFCEINGSPRPKNNPLHLCSAWKNGFFINPFGRLKFCMFSETFSVDLRKTAFKEGFYRAFPRILSTRFTTRSRCRNCRIRAICYHCPAKAELEAGNAQRPVRYFCELAKATEQAMACEMDKVKHVD